MEFKELLAKNWSRKAEMLLIAISGICFVAELCEGLRTLVIMTAIISMAAMGIIGIAAQFLIDWKHGPREASDNEQQERR